VGKCSARVENHYDSGIATTFKPGMSAKSF
jgi:hypothetical protein